MNINSINLKVNQNDKKISQNKIIGQNIKTNGLVSLKSLDSSKGTISTKNINGKKFIFNDKSEKNENLKISNILNSNANVNINANSNVSMNNNNEDKSNFNRFTKIGKDPKIPTKQNDKVKNIFSSKIADN